jgi:hypothetical protein
MIAAWTSRQWAALVGLLVLVILVLTMLWPRSSAPRSIVIEVTDGPTVLSTQVVLLR